MREQLKLLEALQSLDGQLQETEDLLVELPRKLKSMKDDLARVEALLEDERQRLTEAESYKAHLEREVKGEQELLAQTRGKLAAVRTSKEYLAIQREFEAGRRHTGEREEEVIKLMEAIEKFQNSITSHEAELATLRDHVTQEDAETSARMAELESSVGSERSSRADLAKKVRRDILRKYDTIRKRRGGRALVAAVGGVCSGCNMQLPPQLYNIIQRANSVEQCPNCQRIIYYPPASQNEESSETASLA